jgi:hypothetical protein
MKIDTRLRERINQQMHVLLPGCETIITIPPPHSRDRYRGVIRRASKKYGFKVQILSGYAGQLIVRHIPKCGVRLSPIEIKRRYGVIPAPTPDDESEATD